jgi:phage gp36-like protein
MSWSTIPDFYLLGMREEACGVLSTTADVGGIGLITESLNSSKETIESYLRAADVDLPLPDSSVTHKFRSVQCVIAAWELFCVRTEPSSEGYDVLRYRYEDALRWLSRVAKGEIQPIPLDTDGNPEDADPEDNTAGFAVVSDTSRNWGSCV